MTNFAVADATGSGSGWNATVERQSGSGKSAVFAQYCSNGAEKCGAEAANSYVASGQTLPANSLTLNSTGGSFSAQNGSTGTAPTLICASACNVDHATGVKIAHAEVSAGMGTWVTAGFSATSLALNIATTLKALPEHEVYRVNLLWTLSTGSVGGRAQAANIAIGSRSRCQRTESQSSCPRPRSTGSLVRLGRMVAYWVS